MPPLEMLRPIPALARIALAILMFPSSELLMICITFTGALFPILRNTAHGVEKIVGSIIISVLGMGSITVGGRAVTVPPPYEVRHFSITPCSRGDVGSTMSTSASS